MYRESDRAVIADVFGGDEKAFKAGVAKGREDVIRWKDIQTAATVFPELKLDAQEMIIGLLGYLPPDHLIVPHEIAIRTLLFSHRSGSLTFVDLLRQAEEQIKLIRNGELKGNVCLSYNRELYKKYFEYLPEQAETVRIRLTKFLGYEPKLEHSLVVELHLRESLINDKYYFPDKLTTSDMQAINIIKYREVLLSKGKYAADNSRLHAMELKAKEMNEI